MKMTVKIEGLKELDRALGQLPKATAKNVLRRVGLDAGEITAQAARGMAPKLYGHLTENIDVSTKLTPRQAGMHRSMFSDDRSTVEVFIGTGDPAGVTQEFGTFAQSPQPFMRPAWDGTKTAVLERISNSLWAEITKAAARYANKLARRG